ncbi:uncharacterized protein LTR77_001590 [Saxophila tyrrhenica]|uniref:Heterokaryon incompatibility domain-containing protein n=1 Tax=Saxophila tyrrhenica TaxID=1690608 RepID=A0AAV9PL95_9PEZI|nr:hypothetical protein LTR77_001590 [Saxophila tyrrhenica]
MSATDSSRSATIAEPRYVRQVREWIIACDELHGDSCVPEPVSQRPLEDIPRWLIDVDQQCIVPGHSADCYLALSYVWPETREPAKSASTPPRSLLLDEKTVIDFQIPGFLGREETAKQIPRVIGHAMELTSALGERYLWVDRLCIVQNDLSDGGTLSQVAKMDKIYSGAYLTIIAAAPEEMYENGLYMEWPSFSTTRDRYKYDTWPVDWPPEDDWKSLDELLKLPTMTEEEVAKAMSARYVMLSRSRWASRGWTYQEQILCKRAVVFIETGLFWDCHCCVWDGVDLSPGHDFEGIALRHDLGQRFSSRWWPDFAFYLTSYARTMDENSATHRMLCLEYRPFGIAERRVDRNEDASGRSSLPSWSWSGWQAFVDPWSLCSGLSYILDPQTQARAGSWRTKRLVDWQVLHESDTPEPILEPHLLGHHADTLRSYRGTIDGWFRWVNFCESAGKSLAEADVFFTHQRDDAERFRHPIPLVEDAGQESFLNNARYLTCSTTETLFSVATVLESRMSTVSTAFGPSKISVFEDEIFKRGPAPSKACSILVLQQSNGGFAGLLRLMDRTALDEHTTVALIAISTGTASAEDMRKSLEWRIFEGAKDEYEDGNYSQELRYSPAWNTSTETSALLFDVSMAFGKDAAKTEYVESKFPAVSAQIQQRNNESVASDAARPSIFQAFEWIDNRAQFKARNDLLLERSGMPRQTGKVSAAVLWDKVRAKIRDGSFFQQNEAIPEDAPPEHKHLEASNEEFCEFYNVLWIERIDGVEYRKACGWVPKYIWEAYATGPVEVKLG